MRLHRSLQHFAVDLYEYSLDEFEPSELVFELIDWSCFVITQSMRFSVEFEKLLFIESFYHCNLQ